MPLLIFSLPDMSISDTDMLMSPFMIVGSSLSFCITITFFFVAGELFYMGKEYFDLYKRVSKELYDIVSKKYSKIKFNIQSNILSSNKEVINNLIGLVQYINNLTPNTLFTTSFDLYSRFNEFTFNIWKENLIYMQNILQKKIMVEMILLQPSIEYYLNNDDDLTKTLDFILGNQDRFDMSFEEFILNDLINVEFDTPQKGVTKGQSAVFYIDDIVLGGGIIK